MISGGWCWRYCGTLRGMTPDTDQPLTLAQMAGAPRRRTGLVVGIAVGALTLIVATIGVTVLAMRSGSDTPAPASQASTPSSAAAPGTTTAVPSTTPATQSAAKTYKFGEKAGNAQVTATAYAFKQPVAKGATPPDQEGFEWGAADVEVCPAADGTVAHDNWHLVYADHTVMDPSSIGYQQFPQPEYPWDERQVIGGRCIRGWITFAVPVGKKPVMVEYSPRNYVIDWAVS